MVKLSFHLTQTSQRTQRSARNERNESDVTDATTASNLRFGRCLSYDSCICCVLFLRSLRLVRTFLRALIA